MNEHELACWCEDCRDACADARAEEFPEDRDALPYALPEDMEVLP